MAIYDVNGNSVASGGGTDDSLIFDKVYEQSAVINLLDRSKSTIGRMQSPPTVNTSVSGSEVSDFIQIFANNTYVCQVNDTTGKLGIDQIFYYNSAKTYIRKESITCYTDGTYHWIVYTPEDSGYMRYQYANTDTTPNPMVFIGSELSTVYVAYTDGIIDKTNYYYKSNSMFRNVLQRDYLQNNLYGRTVYWFGDSNSDNWASSEQCKAFQKKFGCTIKSYGRYGAHWSDAENGTAASGRNSAIGQYNEFLTDCAIDASTYLFDSNAAFFFMMGTNSGTNIGELPAGGVGAIEDETCQNDVSAMNYILKRMRYYGRNHPLGVFLPWSCVGTKREALIAICEYYCIPYFDIPAMIPEYTHTKGLERPDGTTVSNDYFTDGGVHLATYGWEKFRRIAENWMAYQV